MVIIMIRRCVRKGKENEFLAKYRLDKAKTKHRDFIRETLTKVTNSRDLPIAMRNLPLRCKSRRCITYVNVAMWRKSKSFIKAFKPKKIHDAKLECEDRLRIVLEVVA